MKEIILNVNGMHCEGCENRVKNALCAIDGIEEVIAKHNEGTVTITANENVNIEDIKEKIDDLGFEVKED